MDGDDRNAEDGQLTIGQLARRTGLSVKTIRWYSDQGSYRRRAVPRPAFEWLISALRNRSFGAAAAG